eukprot:2631709-Prymnesium_polylepis.1
MDMDIEGKHRSTIRPKPSSQLDPAGWLAGAVQRSSMMPSPAVSMGIPCRSSASATSGSPGERRQSTINQAI